MTLEKRLKRLEKVAELKQAKKEVKSIFDDVKQVDKIAAVVRKLVHWKRSALKANKELRRIKCECSCGRVVNYPWIIRK